MNNREKLEREYFDSGKDGKICFEDWLIIELIKTRAANIKESRPTVRAKRPAQQAKVKIKPCRDIQHRRGNRLPNKRKNYDTNS